MFAQSDTSWHMEKGSGGKYTNTIAIRLGAELRKKLEEMAEKEERSIGAMARIVLREGIMGREGAPVQPATPPKMGAQPNQKRKKG